MGYFFVVAVDATSGSVFVVGIVSASLDNQLYAGGTSDIALLKYNASGAWQWTRLRGSIGADFGYGGEQRIGPYYDCLSIFGTT